MALGVPEVNIQTEAFGEQKNLTDRQGRAAVARHPGLSPKDRQKVLDHTRKIIRGRLSEEDYPRKIILASNRGADITGSNAGEAWQTLRGNSPLTPRIG
jgi:hypothetical protein